MCSLAISNLSKDDFIYLEKVRNDRNMKHIKCLFTEKQLEIEKLRNKKYHRVTHNKVYEVYSICDDKTKGKFQLDQIENDVYFINYTQEIREEKLKELGIC